MTEVLTENGTASTARSAIVPSDERRNVSCGALACRLCMELEKNAFPGFNELCAEMEPGSVMSDSACRTSTWGQADVARQTFPSFALNSVRPQAVHLEVDFRLLKVHSAPTSKSLGEELSQVLGACQPLIDPDTRNGETRSRRSQRQRRR